MIKHLFYPREVAKPIYVCNGYEEYLLGDLCPNVYHVVLLSRQDDVEVSFDGQGCFGRLSIPPAGRLLFDKKKIVEIEFVILRYYHHDNALSGPFWSKVKCGDFWFECDDNFDGGNKQNEIVVRYKKKIL